MSAVGPVRRPRLGSPAHAALYGWQEDAECWDADPALFFAPAGVELPPDREVRERKAKAICAGCPVSRECLEYALDLDKPQKYGIWGGLNEDERAAERRRRMRAAAAEVAS